METVNNTIVPNVSVVVQNEEQTDKKNKYKDPLRNWPLKGLAYSNELGAVITPISPKLGAALWIPAWMYIGADVYDKWKNDDTTYNPSGKRGLKEAVFQSCASIAMPTAAVGIGQRAASFLARFTKTGLSAKAREDVLHQSLDYMKSHSLHTFVDDPSKYTEGFTEEVRILAEDSRGAFKTFGLGKKIRSFLTPFKDMDNISFAKSDKLLAFASKQADKVMSMRADLMNNVRPKGMSKRLFAQFQKRQVEYQAKYAADKYMGKAVKSILEDYHKSQIFKTKMVKTIGGFVALALLIKPIDNFVEKIVIKKTVEPGIDFLQTSYINIMNSDKLKKPVNKPIKNDLKLTEN